MIIWSRLPFVIVMLFMLGGLGISQEQRKFSRCKIDEKEMNSLKYQIGALYEAPSPVSGGSPMTVVQISIDPKNFSRDDLIRVASKLKNEFCREEKLFVVLYDDATHIKHIYGSNDPGFPQAEESKRGYYYVDRKTGEEYITYSTVRNYLRNPEKRIRIELGPPLRRNPETHL